MSDLELEYLKAYYYLIDLKLDLVVGGFNMELDHYMLINNYKSWTVITAYNPKSVVLCEQDNKYNNENLKNDIKNYTFLNIESGSNSDNWEVEFGFIIFDLAKVDSIKLGKKYNQNAILFGEINKKSEIIFC